ncbi:MAG: rhodanese-like domain-containing protein [Pseudomonadota bacterium]|nr:rhodanese-like domain-containing protein [Pseudomonadota bacterium]
MSKKQTLLASLLGCTLVLLTPLARADDKPDASPAIDIIPQQTLLNYLGGKEHFTLIDARSADEYAAGHIWGAVHVAHDADLAASQELPDDLAAPLVVYCKSGLRAQELQSRLLEAGYANVRVLGPSQMLWADSLPVFNCGASAPDAPELATINSGGSRQ